ncbi:MAG TPA: VOC family protein [Nevskia sp.]|jgi:catechol 2,3-dioxygenase-like lactoylglutathione lyase family enzyme|nr:VOC family protein [Nevskia sp.]
MADEAMEPKPAFRASNEIAVHVADLGKAAHFYGDVLGFRLLGRTERQLEYDTGALRLYVNLDSRPLTSFVPSLHVPDREAAREYLEAAGCKPVHIASQPGLCYLRDPFGLLFDLTARKG